MLHIYYQVLLSYYLNIDVGKALKRAADVADRRVMLVAMVAKE